MEEKKLTDEEIIKALEICAIEVDIHDKDDCKECPYFIKKIDCVTKKRSEKDTLDLIKRQKVEIETLLCKNAELEVRCEGILKDYYAQSQTCDEQRDKIERLTEERDRAKRDNTSLLYNVSRVEKENAELQKQVKDLNKTLDLWQDDIHYLQCDKDELQKQVDKLKEKIMNLKSAMMDRVARKSYDSLLTMPEDVEEIFGDAYESEFNKFLQQAAKDTAKEIYKDFMKRFDLSVVVVKEEVQMYFADKFGVEVE